MKLSINDLCFSYGRKEILKDISCELNIDGTIVALMGPNGSGKSTLMAQLCRTLKGSSGSITIDSRPIEDFSIDEYSRLTAYMAQQSRISLPYTVWEILLMGRHPHRSLYAGRVTDTDLAIIEDVVIRCELEDLIENSVQELSGGERQRVLFAKTLVQTPSIYLLDEPFSQMDIYYQHRCMTILRDEVREKKRSALVILHDLELADIYSDTSILMKNGSIVTNGPSRDVLGPENLKHVFNIDFTRESAESILHVTRR